MRDDRGAASVPLQQTTPLVHQHRWHDQRERLAEREGDCERDVRLAEADGVREQSAPVTPEDAREPLGGGDLVRGEPCRPWRLAFERERREVEQRARPERRDRRRRADRPRREETRERLGERREVLREDPRRMRPVHGGPPPRARTCRQWRRRRTRSPAPGPRGRAIASGWRAGEAVPARRPR